jgi:hypothetical protein
VPVVAPRRPRRRSGRAVSALTLGLAGALAMAPGASASVATAQRVYEQVTPNEKRGSDVQFGIRASADGNAIAFSSLAALDGTPAANVFIYYAAHRSDSGWTTEALVAPNASEAPNLNDTFPPNDLSDDLGTAYYNFPGYSSLAVDDQNNVGDAFMVRGGAATWLTPGLTRPETSGSDAAYAGRSSDGRHVVLETAKQLMPGVRPSAATRPPPASTSRPTRARSPRTARRSTSAPTTSSTSA